MMDIIEKLVGLFCIIVFVTFLVNHGHVNFSGVDWVKEKTTEAITSEEGQQYIEETKEISKNVFKDMFDGIRSMIVDDSDEKKETVTGTNDTEDSPEDTTYTGSATKTEIIYTTALSSPASNNASLKVATYLYCLSANTIKVRINGSEEAIRLIGVKSPADDTFKEMAYDYARSLLKNNDTVYLEYDKDTSDDYGKTLAYVWLSEDTSDIEDNMLNSLLLKNGYAKDSVYSPNDKYGEVFETLSGNAKENRIGLWSYENPY